MLHTLRGFAMLSPGETVGVGCSGGADSMCLLSLLYESSEALGVSVHAIHVNHGIRGEEADADERFVRDYCAARSIPLHVYHADVPGIAAETGESPELCARRVRYAFFAQAPVDKIATAHTASDAAETLLMNLGRGSGLAGLCAIPPKRGNIIRPLIECFREETEAYCDAAGIRYVTDSTNMLDDCTRNRLRHTVIPALTESFPAFEKNALRCVSLLREDAAFLDSAAAERYASVIDPQADALNCSQLEMEAPAVRRRILARFLSERGAAEAEARHILLLEARLSDRRFSLTLPGAVTADIRDGRLTVRPPDKAPRADEAAFQATEISRETGGEYGFGAFLLRIVPRSAPQKSEFLKNNAFYVDFSKIDAIIILRTRQAGDKISLASRGCTKSLKKLMNEKKIPPEERAGWPVLADSRGVIFTPCGGVDASRQPDADTERLLEITLL